MRIKKRLLPLTKIKADKVLAGILAPHAEIPQPNLLTGQDCRCLYPIHFPFLPCLRITGDKGAGSIKPQSLLCKSNVAANSGFASLIPMLLYQAVVYPTRHVALLLRAPLVTRKPTVDHRQIRLKNRKRLMSSLLVAPRIAKAPLPAKARNAGLRMDKKKTLLPIAPEAGQVHQTCLSLPALPLWASRFRDQFS